jgi:hypothetical protein
MGFAPNAFLEKMRTAVDAATVPRKCRPGQRQSHRDNQQQDQTDHTSHFNAPFMILGTCSISSGSSIR